MRRLALCLLATAIPASCNKIESCRAELLLRHDVAANRIDLLLVSEGVSGRSDDALLVARRLLWGKRQIYGDWLFDWDLDDPDTFRTREDFRLFQNLEVVWADAYLDAEGRLSIAQHFRIENAASVVARVNALIREMVLEQGADESRKDAPRPAAERAFAAADRDVFTFRGTVLEVAVPMTDTEAWQTEQLLNGGRGPEGVRAWKIGEGVMVFHFGDPAEAEWTVANSQEDIEYDPSLRKALEEEELLKPDVTKYAILERFRAEASKREEPALGGRRPLEED